MSEESNLQLLSPEDAEPLFHLMVAILAKCTNFSLDDFGALPKEAGEELKDSLLQIGLMVADIADEELVAEIAHGIISWSFKEFLFTVPRIEKLDTKELSKRCISIVYTKLGRGYALDFANSITLFAKQLKDMQILRKPTEDESQQQSTFISTMEDALRAEIKELDSELEDELSPFELLSAFEKQKLIEDILYAYVLGATREINLANEGEVVVAQGRDFSKKGLFSDLIEYFSGFSPERIVKRFSISRQEHSNNTQLRLRRTIELLTKRCSLETAKTFLQTVSEFSEEVWKSEAGAPDYRLKKIKENKQFIQLQFELKENPISPDLRCLHTLAEEALNAKEPTLADLQGYIQETCGNVNVLSEETDLPLAVLLRLSQHFDVIYKLLSGPIQKKESGLGKELGLDSSEHHALPYLVAKFASPSVLLKTVQFANSIDKDKKEKYYAFFSKSLWWGRGKRFALKFEDGNPISLDSKEIKIGESNDEYRARKLLRLCRENSQEEAIKLISDEFFVPEFREELDVIDLTAFHIGWRGLLQRRDVWGLLQVLKGVKPCVYCSGIPGTAWFGLNLHWKTLPIALHMLIQQVLNVVLETEEFQYVGELFEILGSEGIASTRQVVVSFLAKYEKDFGEKSSFKLIYGNFLEQIKTIATETDWTTILAPANVDLPESTTIADVLTRAVYLAVRGETQLARELIVSTTDSISSLYLEYANEDDASDDELGDIFLALFYAAGIVPDLDSDPLGLFEGEPPYSVIYLTFIIASMLTGNVEAAFAKLSMDKDTRSICGSETATFLANNYSGSLDAGIRLCFPDLGYRSVSRVTLYYLIWQNLGAPKLFPEIAEAIDRNAAEHLGTVTSVLIEYGLIDEVKRFLNIFLEAKHKQFKESEKRDLCRVEYLKLAAYQVRLGDNSEAQRTLREAQSHFGSTCYLETALLLAVPDTELKKVYGEFARLRILKPKSSWMDQYVGTDGLY